MAAPGGETGLVAVRGVLAQSEDPIGLIEQLSKALATGSPAGESPRQRRTTSATTGARPFRSAIKYFGRPILPPVLTGEDRAAMRELRRRAVEREDMNRQVRVRRWHGGRPTVSAPPRTAPMLPSFGLGQSVSSFGTAGATAGDLSEVDDDDDSGGFDDSESVATSLNEVYKQLPSPRQRARQRDGTQTSAATTTTTATAPATLLLSLSRSPGAASSTTDKEVDDSGLGHSQALETLRRSVDPRSWSAHDSPSAVQSAVAPATPASPPPDALTALGGAARGFLDRQLLKTDKVKQLVQTIRDCQDVVASFSSDMDALDAGDRAFLVRARNQLAAARFDLAEVFDSAAEDRVRLLARQRQLDEERKFRSSVASTRSRPATASGLSNATRRARERREREHKEAQRPKTTPAATKTRNGSARAVQANRVLRQVQNSRAVTSTASSKPAPRPSPRASPKLNGRPTAIPKPVRPRQSEGF